MRTSQTDPLRIDHVGFGIGLTFCPGKYDAGRWDRDLDADLAVVQAWGATTLVTLIEDFEFDLLRVRALPERARALFEWHHLPIRDGGVPDAAFEMRWAAASLRTTERLVLHCRGGLGRAGLAAARLLVEAGIEPEAAIRQVRKARPGAIETAEQERYVLGLGEHAEPTLLG